MALETVQEAYSRKPIVNALERVGISLASEDISGQSIAAVWLTATLLLSPNLANVLM